METDKMNEVINFLKSIGETEEKIGQLLTEPYSFETLDKFQKYKDSYEKINMQLLESYKKTYVKQR